MLLGRHAVQSMLVQPVGLNKQVLGGVLIMISSVSDVKQQ